jgi:hypothetical protein
MFYGDEPSMRDKPEWMRRDSVRTSVSTALDAFDAEHYVTSFCGEVRRIDDYYVTPVIQIPNETFVLFPPLPPQSTDMKLRGNGFRSLIHAAIHAVLHEATEELQNQCSLLWITARSLKEWRLPLLFSRKVINSPFNVENLNNICKQGYVEK